MQEKKLQMAKSNLQRLQKLEVSSNVGIRQLCMYDKRIRENNVKAEFGTKNEM